MAFKKKRCTEKRNQPTLVVELRNETIQDCSNWGFKPLPTPRIKNVLLQDQLWKIMHTHVVFICIQKWDWLPNLDLNYCLSYYPKCPFDYIPIIICLKYSCEVINQGIILEFRDWTVFSVWFYLNEESSYECTELESQNGIMIRGEIRIW